MAEPMPDSLLPHIQSVFYAAFDVKQGPKIVCQVPEGLIVSSTPVATPLSTLSIPSTPSSEYTPPEIQAFGLQLSPTTSSNHEAAELTLSPDELRISPRTLSSPSTPLTSAQRALFSFDDVHKYIIPHSALCGRLVVCSVKNYRIIGLPVALKGRQYERNYFRYNICFVFERGADLSCYEPIVRKVSRVLTTCEEESRFLSMPSKSTSIHAILEQLYEDLNSFAETSISIDRFNSIELKIFPFYPNPPPVHDWLVPIALINLTKRIDDNWDLTMAKICKFIDGTNHVSRIAHLADCDIKLTRQAISHLLYHQVIMTIDIYQYSNMYTLRKNIQWLADEIHVEEECGPYVTKPGNPIPDWPKLLHLYSRLKPGKTVHEWQEEYEVAKLGIDVRRFTSFGVIKGFLRRVHRWPVYIAPEISHHSQKFQAPTSINASFSLSNTLPRKRGQSLSDIALRYSLTPSQVNVASGDPNANNFQTLRATARPQTAGTSTITFPGSEHANTQGNARSTADPHPVSAVSALSSVQRARRPSTAERVLEQLRSRDKSAAAAAAAAAQSGNHGGGFASPRNSWIPFHHQPRDLLYAQSNEAPFSSTPPTHTTPLVGTSGGQNNNSNNNNNNNGSGTVTPTMTATALHGHGHGPSASSSSALAGIGPGAALVSGSPHNPHNIHHHVHSNSVATTTAAHHSQTLPRRRERIQSSNAPAPPPSPIMSNGTLAIPPRPRISRSPSAMQLGQAQLGSGGSGGGGGGVGSGNSTVAGGGGSGAQPMQGRGSSTLGGGLEYPPQLMPLLDGEHHTDELCTMFEVGWPLLEKWLELIGGGDIGSEDCQVVIIYR